MKFNRMPFLETIMLFCETQVHIALWCWTAWVNSILFFFLQITHLTLFFDTTKFRNMFWCKTSSFRVSGVLFEGKKQYRVYSRCSAPQCNVNFHFIYDFVLWELNIYRFRSIKTIWNCLWCLQFSCMWRKQSPRDVVLIVFGKLTKF